MNAIEILIELIGLFSCCLWCEAPTGGVMGDFPAEFSPRSMFRLKNKGNGDSPESRCGIGQGDRKPLSFLNWNG